MRPVRILQYGLTDSGKIYKAGDVVVSPSPALYNLTLEGRLHEGKKLAEFVEQESVSVEVVEVKLAEPEPEKVIEVIQETPPEVDQEADAEVEGYGRAYMPKKAKRR